MGGVLIPPSVSAVDAALSAWMGFEAYAARKVAVRPPIVLDLRAGRGRVVLVGMRHTHDPADSDLAWLARLFHGLRPSMVYVEGGRPTPMDAVRDSIGAYGEAGLLTAMARRAIIPARTLEPWRLDEARALWPAFGRERTKLFYVLRDLDTWHRGHRAVPIDAHAKVLLDNLARGGVLGRPRAVADLAPMARAFLDTPDWRTLPSAWFDPAWHDAPVYTPEASRRSSQARDAVATHRFARALRAGATVLAVQGFTHVEMCRPVWAALGLVTPPEASSG